MSGVHNCLVSPGLAPKTAPKHTHWFVKTSPPEKHGEALSSAEGLPDYTICFSQWRRKCIMCMKTMWECLCVCVRARKCACVCVCVCGEGDACGNRYKYFHYYLSMTRKVLNNLKYVEYSINTNHKHNVRACKQSQQYYCNYFSLFYLFALL
jgi:hypothetical protein